MDGARRIFGWSTAAEAQACVDSIAFTARLKRLRKKGAQGPKVPQKHPSGAKALLILWALSARLKSCPFKTEASTRVFPQPVKSCPDASGLFIEFFRSLFSRALTLLALSMEFCKWLPFQKI